MIAVIIVAIVAITLVAMSVLASPVFSALAGLWTLSSRPRGALPARWSSSPWRVLRGDLYVPRYVGAEPVAGALTRTATPISVVDAVAACRTHALQCELCDIQGNVLAVVDPDGTVRVPLGNGGEP